MFNLLHMDLRRLRRGKVFYIMLAVFAAIVLFTTFMIFLTSNPALAQAFAGVGISVNVTDMETREIIQDANQMLAMVTSMTKAEFFYSIICKGGGLAVLVAILSTLFVCEDFSGGFAKNIFSIHERRSGYIVAKAVTMMCASGVLALVGTLLSYLFVALFRLPMANGELSTALSYLLQAWLVGSAFAVQNIFLCVLTRSIALGIVGSFICAGGVAAMVPESVLGLFRLSVMEYTLYGCTTAPGLTVKMVLVCAAWIAVYLVLGTLVLRKKDI